MVGRVWRVTVCAGAVALSGFGAQAANLEEMAETIRALQARVETLEARSRRDQVELRAARRERPMPVSAPRLLITKGVPPAIEPLPLPIVNGFEGAYAAVLGGYTFGTDARPGDTVINFGPEQARLSSLANGRVGVTLGYNRVIDDLLFGVEGRIRTDLGHTSANGYDLNTSVRTLPYTFSFGGAAQTSFPDFQLSSAATTRSVLYREVGGDLAARFGITLDDWLFYGRLGAGMEALRVERTVDRSGTITCVSPIVRSTQTFVGFDGFTNTVVGCGSQRAGSVTRSVSTSASPYAVIGLGIERNFGPIFARIEGNLYLNLPPAIAAGSASGTSYAPEILGAVGYRF